ncbi:MAG: IclR family transcriptional regulator [Nitratireductor sp.]
MNKPIAGDGTVGKAIEVLEKVADFGRPVRFSELLESSPHPKATLYRLLQTLTSQGMLIYNDEQQTYSMGLKLLRLAHTAWAQSSLANIASPHLDKLVSEVKETLHLAQMDAGQVVFVDKKYRSAHFDTIAQTGLVAPAHCTGVGKAILAFLSPARLERAVGMQNFYQFTPKTLTSREALEVELGTIKKQGFAFDREEHEVGIISVAAPIIRANGQPLGAVSIASSTHRHSPESLQAFTPNLLETVREISKEAEAWTFPQAD